MPASMRQSPVTKSDQISSLGLAIHERLAERNTSLAIIGLGLALRLLALLLLKPFPLMSDSVAYQTMALALMRNQSIVPVLPPGLPYYMALVQHLGGVGGMVDKVGMVLLYVPFAALLWAMCVRISTRQTASIALLLFAVYPNYVYQNVVPLTQFPVALLMIGIVLSTMLVCERMTWLRLLALGLLLGGACLTRASSLILLVVIPAYLLWRTRRFWPVVLSIVIACLVIGLWLGKAYQMTGHVVPINYANSQNLFIGNNPYTPLYRTWWLSTATNHQGYNPPGWTKLALSIQHQPVTIRDSIYLSKVLTYVIARPDLFVLRTVNRIRVYFAFDTFFASDLLSNYQSPHWLAYGMLALDATFYLLIMAIALFYFIYQPIIGRHTNYVGLLLITIVVYAAPYWMAFSHPTYHFPVVPLFGVVAAIALSTLLARMATGTQLVSTVGAILASGGRARGIALALALTLFAYIQIEWVLLARR